MAIAELIAQMWKTLEYHQRIHPFQILHYLCTLFIFFSAGESWCIYGYDSHTHLLPIYLFIKNHHY